MSSTPTPVMLVVLAALLLSCNVLWLYTTPANQQQRNACGNQMDSWSSNRGGGPTHGELSNGSSVVGGPPSAVHDYQLVRGSGLTDVPQPLPIPNDTVLLGEDIGAEDGLQKRFMTIGISSVWRKDEYLFKTIESLLKETSAVNKKDIFIFLLLADADADFRIRRARDLEIRYKEHIDSGILRVIQPPSVIYPTIDFSNMWRTYNDSVSRVQWRTKQVLDFAFLFWYAYSRQPSDYYLILEDDVVAARHFVTAAKDFVQLHSKRHWVALQLSNFLVIGQLVKCEDMGRLVSFLLLFYKEHPVDMLFNHWVSMMAPERPPKYSPYRRVPGLFQHIGIHSTLANKTQRLRDTTFSLVRRRYSHVNPPAEVMSTIRQYRSFMARSAYSSAPGMFWGIPKAGDTYDIVFHQPTLVTRIVIITGASVTKKRVRDKLQFGQLQVSPKFKQMLSPNRAECHKFVALKEFKNGEVDIEDLYNRFANGIQCIRIVIGNTQRTWISISEIAIFTKNGLSDTSDTPVNGVPPENTASEKNPQLLHKESTTKDGKKMKRKDKDLQKQRTSERERNDTTKKDDTTISKN
uniref:Alpha-1,3-mannosyl-glycoprotein 4-beta-N-acetylglucosaminyltransferase C-like n=1 Tax=Hirondellea gigas TaxID=1518452 RepID=A0A6A7FPM1_9CRUS